MVTEIRDRYLNHLKHYRNNGPNSHYLMRNSGFKTLSYFFINYVEMSEEDSRKIWELRNHPLVAKWMVHPEEIPYAEHKKFIVRLSLLKDKDYYLIKDLSSNIIGSVNIDYTETPYPERGIYINPEFFHQNHAFNSLREFYRYANSVWGVSGIMTRVKTDNIGSNRLEEKLGAKLVFTEEGYNFYNLCFEER